MLYVLHGDSANKDLKIIHIYSTHISIQELQKKLKGHTRPHKLGVHENNLLLLCGLQLIWIYKWNKMKYIYIYIYIKETHRYTMTIEFY